MHCISSELNWYYVGYFILFTIIIAGGLLLILFFAFSHPNPVPPPHWLVQDPNRTASAPPLEGTKVDSKESHLRSSIPGPRLAVVLLFYDPCHISLYLCPWPLLDVIHAWRHYILNHLLEILVAEADGRRFFPRSSALGLGFVVELIFYGFDDAVTRLPDSFYAPPSPNAAKGPSFGCSPMQS